MVFTGVGDVVVGFVLHFGVTQPIATYFNDYECPNLKHYDL
jgi:hypothetical protein